MDKLRSGIYLRSYAQNNPLQQYVQEGFDMFEEMNQRIDREIVSFLLKIRINLQITPQEATKKALQNRVQQSKKAKAEPEKELAK